MYRCLIRVIHRLVSTRFRLIVFHGLGAIGVVVIVEGIKHSRRCFTHVYVYYRNKFSLN